MDKIITQETTYGFLYIRVYKSLLTDAPALGISIDAVYLYSFICSRVLLSAKNHWCDADGRIYVLCSRAEVAETMMWSKRKTIDTFRELLAAGLITEEARTNRAGCTVTPRIFPKQWGAITARCSAEDIRSGCLSYYTMSIVYACPDNYYVLPLCIDGTLSVRARMLYAVALDKIRLSSTFGRVEPNGRVWCELSSDEMQQLLQCKSTTLANTYAELERAGLLHRERHECGCVSRTYLSACWNTSAEVSSAHDAHSISTLIVPHCEDDVYCNEPQNTPKSPEICTQLASLNQSTHTQPNVGSIIRTRAYDASEACKKLICDLNVSNVLPNVCLLAPNGLSVRDMSTVEDIIHTTTEIIQTDMESKSDMVCLGGEYIQKSCLLEHYAMLDMAIYLTLVSKLLPVWTDVKKPRSYLRTSLYRAYDDHSQAAYYTQLQLDEAHKV